MIIDKINEIMPDVMKSGNKAKLMAIRDIKTELTKAKTSGNKYTDDVEMQVIMKMVKQYTTAIEDFNKSGATDLSKEYSEQLTYIKEFAPKDASDEEISAAVKEYVTNAGKSLTMKDMKDVMAFVKSKYPSANGGVVSKIFKTFI